MTIASLKEFILLERVTGSAAQVATLYELLTLRRHSISHIKVPPFKEHQRFVRHHPYRVWYLVNFKNTYIGAAYVTYENCISVTLASHAECLHVVLGLLVRRHRPLKEIKSVRPKNYVFNVAPSDLGLKKRLAKLGAIRIQESYVLPENLKG